MKQGPMIAIIAAGVIALGVVGFFIFKAVKGEDTQGVSYGDTKSRYRQSSGYGQGKPQGSGPASFQQIRDQRMRGRPGNGGQ